jgi:hypothetical protein
MRGLQNRNARFDSSVPRFSQAPGFRGFWLSEADRSMMSRMAALRIDPHESAPIWEVLSLALSPGDGVLWSVEEEATRFCAGAWRSEPRAEDGRASVLAPNVRFPMSDLDRRRRRGR